MVVEKNSALPHPTGSIPPPPAMPTDTDDPDAPEVPLPDDPEVVKARVWYCIEGAEDLRGLADWIKYKGETELYNQELAKQQTPPATTATTAISPTDKTIPGRHILEAVQVPLVKSSKQDLVVKEDFMPLVEKIKKISGFMELAQGE